MPTPEICKSYNLSPKEYDDCINYRGHYSTSTYKHGGIRKVTGIQKKSEGGMLLGPSHDDGGIPAIVDGTEPIELEGGEFVINAQTVNALGEEFLHKLNSTETTYHQGGFQQNQLPTPSKFEYGGRVNYKQKNKLQQGGTPYTPFKKRLNINEKLYKDIDCPTGMYKENGACFPITGNTYRTTPITNVTAPILREGGSVKPKRKLKEGGVIRGSGIVQRSTGNTLSRVGVHSHIMNIDVDGNGFTTSVLGHKHRVINHQVEITCPDGKNCHSH